MELFFPRRCPMCDAVTAYGEDALCSKHGSLPFVKEPVCLKCGKTIENERMEFCADCTKSKKSFIRCYPIFNYSEPVRSSVLRIKYDNRREYLDYYAVQMVRKLESHISRIKPDGLVPVPIHRKKLKERGYNQAYELAVRVGKKLDIPVYKELLVREEYTAPQKGLGHNERYKNIRGAIRPGKSDAALDTVILIDDIYTTGATAEECTKALKEVGITNVYVAVICIGAGD